MLPLGPKWLQLNSMVAAAGLNIFFFLSGFLVVSILLRNDNIPSFFVRRLFRIVPLAYVVTIPLLIVLDAPMRAWSANLLFYANIWHDNLLHPGDHLWSLSVEVQFYVAVGLTVALLGRRGLALVPVACLAVTALRIAYGMNYSIITWFRIDEILAGGSVAYLLDAGILHPLSPKWSRWAPYLLLPALFLCCHGELTTLNYIHPYVAALLVFSTMHRQQQDLLQRALTGPVLKYCAVTSYALYVIHPVTYAGWMGEGGLYVKYAKRMVSFALTFAFAHVSSFYYERFFNNLGHRIAQRLDARRAAAADAVPISGAPLAVRASKDIRSNG